MRTEERFKRAGDRDTAPMTDSEDKSLAKKDQRGATTATSLPIDGQRSTRTVNDIEFTG